MSFYGFASEIVKTMLHILAKSQTTANQLRPFDFDRCFEWTLKDTYSILFAFNISAERHKKAGQKYITHIQQHSATLAVLKHIKFAP